jgi:cytochrome P460
MCSFMVKDSKKYAAAGGWGFADFKDGKPSDEALHKTCFPCHVPAKDRDYVFACSVGNYPETGFEEASRIGNDKSASRTRNHCGTAGRHPCQSQAKLTQHPTPAEPRRGESS